jgi:broad specificity phosphatase PhoE
MNIAALLANGKVITGCNHGDAFGKLSPDEQKGKIISGFIDGKTGKFTGDDLEFYIKEVILVRHAEVDDLDDPEINETGRSQALRAARFLYEDVDLSGYSGLVSPLMRCIQTSNIFQDILELDFKENINLLSQVAGENNDEFTERVDLVIKNLPAKSLLISHEGFIINLVRLINGAIISCLPYCSLTYVNNQEIKWVGKSV